MYAFHIVVEILRNTFYVQNNLFRTSKTILIELTLLHLGYYVIHAYFADYHKLSIHSLIPVCQVLLCFYDVISLKCYVDYFTSMREEKEISIKTVCEIPNTGRLIQDVSML